MNLDELRSLFAYDTWANDLILDAAKGLPEEAVQRDLGASHRSLLGTLVHIVAAEEIWLSRWKGAPLARLTGLDEISSFETLLAFWGKVRKERDSFVASLGEADLERELEMTNSQGDDLPAPLRRHVPACRESLELSPGPGGLDAPSTRRESAFDGPHPLLSGGSLSLYYVL